jgi:hypothetical protein
MVITKERHSVTCTLMLVYRRIGDASVPIEMIDTSTSDGTNLGFHSILALKKKGLSPFNFIHVTLWGRSIMKNCFFHFTTFVHHDVIS